MLVLASASVARKNLLINAGIPHRVIVSDVDESLFEDSDPSGLVQSLAIAKAKDVASKIKKEDVLPSEKTFVLGCDSIFVFEDQIYGKPLDKNEAISRWKKMSSNEGKLYTGHALIVIPSFNSLEINNNRFENLTKTVVKTSIKFLQLQEKEIYEYVETGEPLNCAGGFAIEGIGGKFIERIEGCYSNVIGISLPWLYISMKGFVSK